MRRIRRLGVLGTAASLVLTVGAVLVQAPPAVAATLTWTVNNVGDGADANVGNGTCATSGGQCTLRAAIEEANAHPADTNRIHFGIGGTIQTTAGTSPQLPPITAPNTVVDGTTAPGYAGTPLVTLRGTVINPGYPGFLVQAADVTIKGLRIGNWGRGIHVEAPGANVHIEANQIGSAGGAYDPNLAVGIGIKLEGPAPVVGGPAAAQRNVIAGFLAKGISAQDGATGGVVEGNRFGTNAAGTASAKHPDGTQIITFDGAATPNTAIETTAGTFTIRGNQISGNAGYGIGVHHVANATIVGNLIGTTADGASALGNTGTGILVQHDGSHAQIGGTGVGDGNVVAATQAANVVGYETGSGIGVEKVSDATIEGNWVGTNPAGANLASAGPGIVVSDDGTDATIGGTAAGAGNTVIGNASWAGIIVGGVTGTQEVAATIQGNRIGTNQAGTAKVGTTGIGVWLQCGSKVLLGGSAAGAGNLISGASNNGVSLCDAKRGTVVQGNRIGTNAAGTAGIPNRTGLAVSAPNNLVTLGATKVLIGGTAAGAGNVISGNGGGVTNNQVDLAAPADVQGNRIGTNAAGTAALNNAVVPGIVAGINAHSSGVVIGGSAPGAGNLLSGFSLPSGGGYGILLSGSPGAVVQGNKIGTDLTGTVALQNNLGIGVQSSDGAVIGGVGAGEGNLIANTKFQGIFVFPTTFNVTMRGNLIHANGALSVSLHYFYDPSGANKDQLPPTMTANVGAQTAVSGTVKTDVAGPVHVDVYAADVCGADDSGQSKQFLGTITFAHPGGGVAQAFAGNVPAPSPGNVVVTGTATVAGNGTSQFSECNPYSDLQVVSQANATKAPVGDEVAALVTVTNRGPDPAPGVVADLKTYLGPDFAADEYVADVPSKGSVDHDAETWTIGTLASGASATVCLRETIVRATHPTDFGDVPTIMGLGADTAVYEHDPRTGNDNGEDVVFVGPREGDLPLVCPLPTVSINDVQITRPTSGTANMTFTVSLSKGQGRDVSVKYATQNGTAASVIDYVATSGTLTIPAGQVSKTFTVPIVGNQSDEPDKSFTVVLSEPTKATIADGSGTGTIKANGALAGCPPSATKNQAFVCHLYFDALNRAAETGGFNYWVNRLNNGDPRANMAKTYMAQPESRRVLVNRIFIFYLGRNGTADELKSWADKLAAKTTTPEKIRISLLASNSYYSKAGSTAEKWVVSVYRDVFRRDPDAGGKQFWLNKLNAGQTRTQVATGMLTTDEGRRRVIDDIFLRFVRRFPPQSESTPWVSQIKAGKTEIDIMVAVIASNEYYNRP